MSIPHLGGGERQPRTKRYSQGVRQASLADGGWKPGLGYSLVRRAGGKAEQTGDQVQVLGSLLLFGG